MIVITMIDQNEIKIRTSRLRMTDLLVHQQAVADAALALDGWTHHARTRQFASDVADMSIDAAVVWHVPTAERSPRKLFLVDHLAGRLGEPKQQFELGTREAYCDSASRYAS